MWSFAELSTFCKLIPFKDLASTPFTSCQHGHSSCYQNVSNSTYNNINSTTPISNYVKDYCFELYTIKGISWILTNYYRVIGVITYINNESRRKLVHGEEGKFHNLYGLFLHCKLRADWLESSASASTSHGWPVSTAC